jgi:EAL domain-containing protein (putative c-di-GMP-specific phosphodiesterase class I)
MLTDLEDMAIIEGVIGLAEAFQIHVIAEGVETAEEYQYLKDSGCVRAQGFYFEKPLSPEHFLQQVNKVFTAVPLTKNKET